MLSSFNKAYLAVVLLAVVVLFIPVPDKTPYMIGSCAGRMMGLALLPCFFAWVAWRLSKEKKPVASVTFNVVLTLAVLGQVGQIAWRIQESKAMDDLQASQAEMRKRIAEGDIDQAELGAMAQQHADKIESTFEELSETATGDEEKRFYGAMDAFVEETRANGHRWNTSFEAVCEPRVLDYSLLTTEAEYAAQRAILNKYVSETQRYLAYHGSMLATLQAKLDEAGAHGGRAQGAITGARRTYELQKPVFVPLMETHVKYGQTMLAILDLLEKNGGRWAVGDGELVFEDDATSTAYNGLIEDLGQCEESINSLQGKLLELR
ncbi:MAG: hypothetical protein JXR94_09800 [Candidatus Hydrogenedentes bacterium]|nr:hypothetical protein [Candidatus Hydrogenedentota bacterium]